MNASIRSRITGLVVLVVILAGLIIGGHARAQQRVPLTKWQGPVRSSWYGPGLYGNRTACGQTLRTSSRGVAHRSLPCGTVLQIRRHRRILTVTVIDRGPFVHGRTFDLTGRTAQDLCRCRRPDGIVVHSWRVVRTPRVRSGS